MKNTPRYCVLFFAIAIGVVLGAVGCGSEIDQNSLDGVAVERNVAGTSESAPSTSDARASSLTEFMGAGVGVYEVEVRGHPAMAATIRCEVSLWSRNLTTFKVSSKVVDLEPGERTLVSLNYTVGMPLDTLFTEEDCRYK